MNETETTMCERCNEDEATCLIEHVLYAEAVCAGCRRDEYVEGERLAHIEDMREMREEYARD